MDHDQRVKKVSEDVKKFYVANKKFRIYHGSTNSTRKQNFKEDEIVDISDFNHVLEVDKDKGYAIVEPNVPMDQLADETLKYGVIPPVVMEFPGITVGGGIQGGAGESSSFKYGLFHNIVEELEIILGNGEIVIASPTKNSDLFHGTAGSYGSLGIITKAKIKIIPAKPYVRLTYTRVESFKDWIDETVKDTQTNADYVDGIMFSKDLGTVITGNLNEKEDLPISTFSGAWDDWFYLHAEKIVNEHENFEELVPIKDFLFRYDRGGFWVGVYPFKKVHIPFNKLTRAIFNPVMHTKPLYRTLHAVNISQRFFIQDFALPEKTALEFLDYTYELTKIFPLWICPLKPTPGEELSVANLKSDVVIDIGVWGKLKIEFDEFVKLNRDFEAELTKLGGRKWLYAHSYFTEEEFWKVYDKPWYETLRKKYFADKTLPTIFDKTSVKEKYDYSKAKGLWEVIKSPGKIPISK